MTGTDVVPPFYPPIDRGDGHRPLARKLTVVISGVDAPSGRGRDAVGRREREFGDVF